MPRWLSSIGLGAYEYQCTYGVRIKEAKARLLGERAAEYGIRLSIHAPYYVSLATADPVIVQNTRRHLLSSLRAAGWMGARRVVFHPGGLGGLLRAEALSLAMERLGAAIDEAEAEGLEVGLLSPELAGKKGQLGNLSELADFYRLDPRLRPTVDFAHHHAVSGGGLRTKDDFDSVFTCLEQNLGPAALEDMHFHLSPIEYNQGGEKKHRTLLEEEYGPPFKPLAETIRARAIRATVICESWDRMAEDALLYQEAWRKTAHTEPAA